MAEKVTFQDFPLLSSTSSSSLSSVYVVGYDSDAPTSVRYKERKVSISNLASIVNEEINSSFIILNSKGIWLHNDTNNKWYKLIITGKTDEEYLTFGDATDNPNLQNK